MELSWFREMGKGEVRLYDSLNDIKKSSDIGVAGTDFV